MHYKIGQTFVDKDGCAETIWHIYIPLGATNAAAYHTRIFTDPVTCLLYSLTGDPALIMTVKRYEYYQWIFRVSALEEIT